MSLLGLIPNLVGNLPNKHIMIKGAHTSKQPGFPIQKSAKVQDSA